MRRVKNAKQLEDNVFQKRVGIICIVAGEINLLQRHCRQHSIFVCIWQLHVSQQHTLNILLYFQCKMVTWAYQNFM